MLSSIDTQFCNACLELRHNKLCAVKRCIMHLIIPPNVYSTFALQAGRSLSSPAPCLRRPVSPPGDPCLMVPEDSHLHQQQQQQQRPRHVQFSLEAGAAPHAPAEHETSDGQHAIAGAAAPVPAISAVAMAELRAADAAFNRDLVASLSSPHAADGQHGRPLSPSPLRSAPSGGSSLPAVLPGHRVPPVPKLRLTSGGGSVIGSVAHSARSGGASSAASPTFDEFSTAFGSARAPSSQRAGSRLRGTSCGDSLQVRRFAAGDSGCVCDAAAAQNCIINALPAVSALLTVYLEPNTKAEMHD